MRRGSRPGGGASRVAHTAAKRLLFFWLLLILLVGVHNFRARGLTNAKLAFVSSAHLLDGEVRKTSSLDRVQVVPRVELPEPIVSEDDRIPVVTDVLGSYVRYPIIKIYCRCSQTAAAQSAQKQNRKWGGADRGTD